MKTCWDSLIECQNVRGTVESDAWVYLIQQFSHDCLLVNAEIAVAIEVCNEIDLCNHARSDLDCLREPCQTLVDDTLACQDLKRARFAESNEIGCEIACYNLRRIPFVAIIKNKLASYSLVNACDVYVIVVLVSKTDAWDVWGKLVGWFTAYIRVSQC